MCDLVAEDNWDDIDGQQLTQIDQIELGVCNSCDETI